MNNNTYNRRRESAREDFDFEDEPRKKGLSFLGICSIVFWIFVVLFCYSLTNKESSDEQAWWVDYGLSKEMRALIAEATKDDATPDKQFELADHYFHGTGGLPRNYTKAVPLLEKAEKAGYKEARGLLAECYENGYGVKESPSKAKELRFINLTNP